MHSFSVAWSLCLVASSNAFFFDPNSVLGFGFPSYSVTSSGKAHCVTGNVQVKSLAGTAVVSCCLLQFQVTVNATNQHILIPDPANQLALTELFTEYLQVNSSVGSEVNGGSKFVEGTYNINAKLCYPMLAVSASQFTSIEFLIHGIGYDKSYWDLAPGYRYIHVEEVANMTILVFYIVMSTQRLTLAMQLSPMIGWGWELLIILTPSKSFRRPSRLRLPML